MLWEVLLLSLGALLGLVAVAVTLLLWLAQLQGNSSRRRDRTRNTTPHPALHSPPTHLAPLDTQTLDGDLDGESTDWLNIITNTAFGHFFAEGVSTLGAQLHRHLDGLEFSDKVAPLEVEALELGTRFPHLSKVRILKGGLDQETLELSCDITYEGDCSLTVSTEISLFWKATCPVRFSCSNLRFRVSLVVRMHRSRENDVVEMEIHIPTKPEFDFDFRSLVGRNHGAANNPMVETIFKDLAIGSAQSGLENRKFAFEFSVGALFAMGDANADAHIPEGGDSPLSESGQSEEQQRHWESEGEKAGQSEGVADVEEDMEELEVVHS